MTFPDPENITEIGIKVDLSKEPDCLWYGGVYDFIVTVPKSYPHSAPKAKCQTPVSCPILTFRSITQTSTEMAMSASTSSERIGSQC